MNDKNEHSRRPRMYRVAEAGDLLGVSRGMVYKVIASGELPAVRIGRSVRVPADALDAFIERKLNEATAAATS